MSWTQHTSYRLSRFLVIVLLFFKHSHGFLLPSCRLSVKHRFVIDRQDYRLFRHEALALSALASEIVNDLDLVPLMKQIAAHAVTLRGRKALLALVQDEAPESYFSSQISSKAPSRARRAQGDVYARKHSLKLCEAESAQQARKAYEWVEQAQLVLRPAVDKNGVVCMEPLPQLPFYGDNGPWETSVHADTDDDEWLDLPVLEWTLQDVLKAEKVIDRLLQVHDWSRNCSVTTWTPLLADKASQISAADLRPVLGEIEGSVQVRRVKSALDPSGRSSFLFELSEERFPVLRLLRAKLADLKTRINREPSLQSKLDDLRQELEDKEEAIRFGLCQAIANVRLQIDEGLNAMALLDTVLAKAAFSILHNGVIPRVEETSSIFVTGFVHPVLSEQAQAIPIDLRLSEASSHATVPPRALIISGPNGGGKTLAMKSFGLASQMVKLGIPIPVSSAASAHCPSVGFFGRIITALGDRQSVESGQSTFMAQLSSYAEILEELDNMETKSNTSVLVLIDELGSGTEADGGGAIGQAVIEHMIESKSCRVVATTHSDRLKATSFHDDRFDCATVLLEEISGIRKPSYRLEYGLIGESFALEAAARSRPALPESVLLRAAELYRPSFANDTVATQQSDFTDHEYLQALTASMERQKSMAKNARQEAEMYLQEMATCRAAMIQLAKQYNRQLGYWETRVTDCYERLLNDQTDSLELLGNTLDEIRLAQKRVETSAEQLRRRGLRFVPGDHVLSNGESVVVVGSGPWEGAEGRVINAVGEKVEVSISLSPLEPEQVVTLRRHEIAIWDYDSVLEDGSSGGDWQVDRGWGSASREDSNRRLNGILSSLGSTITSTSSSPSSAGKTPPAQSTYTSSRQRKAAKKRKRK